MPRTATTNRKPTPAISSIFMLRNDPVPTTTFIPGECICKVCRSTKLRFIPYLEDAKCETCDQYQNEPEIAALS